jgi:glycosyltransferase involved in cell wall biosynthesis
VQARVIRRIIAQRNIELVYVNGPRLLPAAVLGARSLPVVFHAHSRVAQQAAYSLQALCLRLGKVVVIASSAFVAEPLRRHTAPEHLHLVYNGVPAIASRPRERDGAFRIGLIGRIAPEKGQLEFVQAARLAIPNTSQLKFVICGAPMFSRPGYHARVQAAAEGLPVEFMGWRDDVSPVMASLDLLAVPSGADEATPRIIMEAYSARIPVVAFRSGGIPEIVEDGRTGWLVEPGAAALAAKFRDLSSNRAQLSEAAERAYQAWRDRYALERYQREVVCILERHHQRTPLHSAGSSAPA